MKHNRLISILLVLLCFGAVSAQKKRGVELKVVKIERSSTASRTDDLIHLKIKLTNVSGRDLPYTNNRFVLEDSEGEKHLVSRGWYPQGKLLEPGQSVELERVYFEIPKDRKPRKVTLYWRLIPLGSTTVR